MIGVLPEMTFEEIRSRVMSMPETDCRQELADTLELLGGFEHDVGLICQLVHLALAQHPVKEQAEIASLFARRTG